MGDASDEMRDWEEEADEIRTLHQMKKCGGVQADCPLCIIDEDNSCPMCCGSGGGNEPHLICPMCNGTGTVE